MEQLDRLLAPHPRVRVGRAGEPNLSGKCVLYWMQRAQRGVDNPALNMAIVAGNRLGLSVIAAFGLTADYPGAQRRHYRFLIEGLADATADLVAPRRPTHRPDRAARPGRQRTGARGRSRARHRRREPGPRWCSLARRAAETLRVPLYLVDSDVVVPSSLFPNEEHAARTIRPKIHRVWHDYLKPLPTPAARVAWSGEPIRSERVEIERLLGKLKVQGASELPDYKGGTDEAMRRLDHFIKHRLPSYATARNEPTPYMTSELSAHLHFGHISPLTIALAVGDSAAPRDCVDTYLEELIVRRELAINFVARNPRYDSLAGCPEWGKKTLAAHAADPRPKLYTARQLEAAETADPLWNASQKEMVYTGRMHNYLRMYWAKKILEWTPDAETAFAIAVDLNDRYEMDGRDPNGYTGIAWAIGGKHDRPWPERPIFGTIRFMSDGGARKKFDVDRYIARVEAVARGGQPGDQPE